MDTLNSSTNWSSVSPSMNDSAQYTTDSALQYNIITVVLGVIGLPGNVFVIAVYIGNMTTSTNVYMFALAVADTAICICAIILKHATNSYLTLNVVLFSIDLAISFSMHLLAFVSIERLVAICWPHKFNMSAVRAKTALCIMAVATFVSGVVLVVARLRSYELISRIVRLLIIVICVMIMTVCYAAIAIRLLTNARVARQKVGVIVMSMSSTGNSQQLNSAVGTAETKQAKALRGVCLVFIVTVVFIASWLPQWLSYVGVSVSIAMKRIFLLNSIVNPFIYSVASAMFRDDAKQFCSKTISRLTACCR